MRTTLIALTAGLLTMGCAQGQVEESAATDPRVAVVMDMVDAWNTRDWDRINSLFAEDGSLHSMMVEPVVGREAIGERIGHLGAGLETITLNIRHVGLVDNVVFLERTDEFVYNGHAGSVPVVGVIEVEDGLITEWREYYDRAELLEALGLTTDFDSAGR
ncbi:nuclear transport factor 2 family protein [Maricaulis sp.]|uniref:nuclear transport factor 2 family protein n=1 Tax=Maricaulis sp. TaxID=1486257 RepID=UPI003A92679F